MYEEDYEDYVDERELDVDRPIYTIACPIWSWPSLEIYEEIDEPYDWGDETTYGPATLAQIASYIKTKPFSSWSWSSLGDDEDYPTANFDSKIKQNKKTKEVTKAVAFLSRIDGKPFSRIERDVISLALRISSDDPDEPRTSSGRRIKSR